MKSDLIPNHVAMILDGNRRWAMKKGWLPTKGHRHGAQAVEDLIEHLHNSGVHTVSIWIFSTENWITWL